MNKTSRQIECLARIETVGIGVLDLIMEFLMAENLMNKEERRVMLAGSAVPKSLHTFLANLSKEGKLQLLEYEWNLLPIERIKITVVTDRNSKEFTYNH
jgi:hypothetical protein